MTNMVDPVNLFTVFHSFVTGETAFHRAANFSRKARLVNIKQPESCRYQSPLQ